MNANAFWHGRPLNAFHWACLRSFLQNGHTLTLHTYEDVDVPDGVIKKDASETLPRDQLFFFQNPATGQPDVSPFSDLFRYTLLHDSGGLYVDIDTVCLTAAVPADDHLWAQECPRMFPNRASTGILAMPKGSDLAKAVIERCRARIERYSIREELGAELFSEVVRERGLPLNMGADTTLFYPIYWIEIFKLALSEFSEEVSAALGPAAFLSGYQSMFHYCGIDLAVTPPRGSYLRRLYETLAPDRMIAAEYTAEEILSLVRAYLMRHRQWAVPELAFIAGDDVLRRIGLEPGSLEDS